MCVYGEGFPFLSLFLLSFDRRCLDTQLTRTRTYASTELAHTHTRDVESKPCFEFISYYICSVSVLYDFPFCAGAFFFRGGATRTRNR